MTYRNRDMEAVCDLLIELGCTPEQVNLMAQDLTQEFMETLDAAQEQFWNDQHDPETIAQRKFSFEECVIAAGRGHLLK